MSRRATARPSSRDRKGSRRPRDPLWARLATIVGALLMVGGGATVAVPKVLAAWLTNNIPRVDSIPEELHGRDISGAINVLLLGTDDRDEAGVDEGARADSSVLVHIPATHDRVFMISLPRDARVEIPPFPETNFAGGVDKLNAAFSYGARVTGPGPAAWARAADLSLAGRTRGAALTMKAISRLVPGGLTFNGLAIIDFDGFEAVVKALGGVHLCVDTDVYSIHYYPNGEKAGNPLQEDYGGHYGDGKHYAVDCYDMQPWEALDYSRQRYGLPNSDYDRQRHQQQLLKAIMTKIASPNTLTNLNTIGELRKATGDLLMLDLGGHPLEDWLFTLSSLRADDLVMVKTNGGHFADFGDGSSDQRLIPETYELLHSVQTDTVFDFLNAHPGWIADDRS